jgi:hypothetical protein
MSRKNNKAKYKKRYDRLVERSIEEENKKKEKQQKKVEKIEKQEKMKMESEEKTNNITIGKEEFDQMMTDENAVGKLFVKKETGKKAKLARNLEMKVKREKRAKKAKAEVSEDDE